MSKSKNERLSARISPDLKKKLQREANARGITVTDYVDTVLSNSELVNDRVVKVVKTVNEPTKQRINQGEKVKASPAPELDEYHKQIRKELEELPELKYWDKDELPEKGIMRVFELCFRRNDNECWNELEKLCKKHRVCVRTLLNTLDHNDDFLNEHRLDHRVGRINWYLNAKKHFEHLAQYLNENKGKVLADEWDSIETQVKYFNNINRLFRAYCKDDGYNYNIADMKLKGIRS